MDYAEMVTKEGKRLFGEKFVPILNFLSRDLYYSLMDDADVAIMFHNRPQAGGNILTLLKKGKKLYMKEQSNIYRLYREWGINILPVNEIHNKKIAHIKSSLSQREIKENNKILDINFLNKEKRIKQLNLILNE